MNLILYLCRLNFTNRWKTLQERIDIIIIDIDATITTVIINRIETKTAKLTKSRITSPKHKKGVCLLTTSCKARQKATQC